MPARTATIVANTRTDISRNDVIFFLCENKHSFFKRKEMPTPDASQFTNHRKNSAVIFASTNNLSRKSASHTHYTPPPTTNLNIYLPYSNKSFLPKNTQKIPIELSYEVSNVEYTSSATKCTITVTAIFGIHVVNIHNTEKFKFKLINSNTAVSVLDNYFLPINSTIKIPLTFFLNDGMVSENSVLLIDKGSGSTLSTPQLYPSSDVPVDSGGSIYFTGNNGYACFDPSSDFLISQHNPSMSNSGDFSIMFWQYLESSTQFPTIFSLGSNTSKFSLKIEQQSSGSFFYLLHNESKIKLNAQEVSITDSWHHIALVREKGNLKFYLDGKNISLTRLYDSIGSSEDYLFLGNMYTRNNPQEEFKGYISKFVFDNGGVRITENYIPETIELSVVDETKILLLCNDYESISVDSSGKNNNLKFYGNSLENTPGFSPRS